MKCPLVRERAARHISQWPSKINHRHTSTPFASYFAGVMQDIAIHHGEIVEQQSLPVISELIETKLRKATAQLRADLREDMQLEIIEQIKTITRNSDNRLAGLIVRAVRDSGIIRRLLYALVAKTHGAAFATEAYESAREKAGQELASRITAKKEAD
jgi:gamma-glutamylcysteine synthetase